MIYIIMFMIVITKDGVINVSTSSKLPQRRVIVCHCARLTIGV